jgi:UDP-3-O-[3-hydroxymyristoyl] glucosamine N-acyltransferase
LISTVDILSFLTSSDIPFEFNGLHTNIVFVADIDSLYSGGLGWFTGELIEFESLNNPSALIVGKSFIDKKSEYFTIRVENPRLTMAKVIKHFFITNNPSEILGVVDDSAVFGKNFSIGRYSVLGKNCIVGDNVTIGSNVVIEAGCYLGNNVTISHGSVIGSAGFGFVRDESNVLIHFPHIGKVLIYDDVEIGANTCIDRGTLSDTIVEKGTKISNFCQISHNVKVGKNVIIAGKAQLSGGVVVGDNSYIGPNSIISNGILVGKGSDVKLGSVVVKNVNDGESVSGNFASPHKRNLLHWAKLNKK